MLCAAVYEIANAYNYDNSDTMTDYFDKRYYLTLRDGADGHSLPHHFDAWRYAS
jgi:hypothetical protein